MRLKAEQNVALYRGVGETLGGQRKNTEPGGELEAMIRVMGITGERKKPNIKGRVRLGNVILQLVPVVCTLVMVFRAC